MIRAESGKKAKSRVRAGVFVYLQAAISSSKDLSPTGSISDLDNCAGEKIKQKRISEGDSKTSKECVVLRYD